MPMMKVTSEDTLEEVSKPSDEAGAEHTGTSKPDETETAPSPITVEELFNPKPDTETEKAESGQKPEGDGGDGKPKYKFNSLDEFQKGYTEAEKKMHEATEKASNLEKETEALRQTVITLSQKSQQAQKEGQPNPYEAIDQKMAEEIGQIDFATDPEANKKLAKIIANTSRQIAALTLQETRTKEKTVETVNTGLKGRLAQFKVSETETLADFYDDLFLPTIERLWADPVYRAMSDEQQFAKAVAETQKFIGRVRGTGKTQPQQQRADIIKNVQGIGRGGTIPIKTGEVKEDNQLGSLTQDMKEFKRQRREETKKAL